MWKSFSMNVDQRFFTVCSTWFDGQLIFVMFQGFGFITFDTKEEAEIAKKGLNGTIVEGRKIEVCDLLIADL